LEFVEVTFQHTQAIGETFEAALVRVVPVVRVFVTHLSVASINFHIPTMKQGNKKIVPIQRFNMAIRVSGCG
jgi:hypothetical protein